MISFASAKTLNAVREDGRWQGAVTRRTLPDIDSEAIPSNLRQTVSNIWLMQAATEARVAQSFATILDALERLGADSGIIKLAQRAIDDEHRHAALCEDVAGRYVDGCAGPYTPLPRQQPRHATANDEIKRVLYVVGQCALNETFAGAYLSCAHSFASEPLAINALRELSADEIDHARIGWAFLLDTPEKYKRILSDWLMPLVVCNLREWKAIQLPEDDALAAHGIPPKDAANDAIDSALKHVIIPGFVHAGLDTRELERWVKSGADLGASHKGS